MAGLAAASWLRALEVSATPYTGPMPASVHTSAITPATNVLPVPAGPVMTSNLRPPVSVRYAATAWSMRRPRPVRSSETGQPCAI